MWYHQLDAAGGSAHVFVGSWSYRQWVVLLCLLPATSTDIHRNRIGICRHFLAGTTPSTGLGW